MERITVQIRRSYGDAPLLVIKDPRMCRLPLYLDALDVMDIEPLVILQIRPVAEVVQSLVGHDDMQDGLAEFLWLRSIIEAEWQTRNCRRVWVSMAEMIEDWLGAVRSIAGGLRVEWPMDAIEATDEIATFLKPRLWHRVAPVAGGDRFCDTVWTAAEHGLAGDDPSTRAAFDAVRGALHDFDRM